MLDCPLRLTLSTSLASGEELGQTIVRQTNPRKTISSTNRIPASVMADIRRDLKTIPNFWALGAQDEALKYVRRLRTCLKGRRPELHPLHSLLQFPPDEMAHRAAEYYNVSGPSGPSLYQQRPPETFCCPLQLLIIPLVLLCTITLPLYLSPPQYLQDGLANNDLVCILNHYILGAVSIAAIIVATLAILSINVVITRNPERIRINLAIARRLFSTPVQASAWPPPAWPPFLPPTHTPAQVLLIFVLVCLPALLVLTAITLYNPKVLWIYIGVLVVSFVPCCIWATRMLTHLSPLHWLSYFIPFAAPFQLFAADSMSTLLKKAHQEARCIDR